MIDTKLTIIAAGINAAVLFSILIVCIPFARWLEKGSGIRSCCADAIKIIAKRTGKGVAAFRPLAIISPAIAVLTPIAAAAFIPLLPTSVEQPTPLFFTAPHEAGLLLATALMILGTSAPLVAGWSSRSAFAMLGGLRAPAQMMNTGLALIAALISVVVASGSLDISAIISDQAEHLSRWYIVRQPLAFLIVSFATLSASMRPPFDAPHNRRELIAGYMMDADGGSVVLFTLSHYLMTVVGSLLITALFLGGGSVPGLNVTIHPYLDAGIYSIAFLFKTIVFMFVLSNGRRIIARMRLDQFMHVGWKMALPLAVLNFVVTIVLYALGV